MLEPESASMRMTKATPKTTMPSVVATRRVRPSCDVSAPTATKTAGATAMLSTRRKENLRPIGHCVLGGVPAISAL